LTPEEAVIIETPGAGGYGPPTERAPEDLARDREAGKFSTTYLERHYGTARADKTGKSG
jgi:N-methylhydantoinase B